MEQTLLKNNQYTLQLAEYASFFNITSLFALILIIGLTFNIIKAKSFVGPVLSFIILKTAFSMIICTFPQYLHFSSLLLLDPHTSYVSTLIFVFDCASILILFKHVPSKYIRSFQNDPEWFHELILVIISVSSYTSYVAYTAYILQMIINHRTYKINLLDVYCVFSYQYMAFLLCLYLYFYVQLNNWFKYGAVSFFRDNILKNMQLFEEAFEFD